MSGITGPEVSKSQGISPASGENVITAKVDSTIVDSRIQSTLSESEQIAALIAVIAAFPTLPPPTVVLNNTNELEISKVSKGAGSPNISQVSAIAFIEMYIDAKNKIIMNMLDAWLKNIREIADRIQEEINSPKYQAWLEQQSPQYRAKVEMLSPKGQQEAIIKSPEYRAYVASLQQTHEILARLANGLDDYTQRVQQGNKTAIQALPFFSSMFVAGVSAPLPGAVVSSGISQAREVVSPGVFEQVWKDASLIIPGNAGVQLGWIAALVGAGLMNQTLIDTIPNFKPGSKPQQVDITDARVFAKNVIEILNNPEINLFVQAMVINRPEESQMMADPKKATAMVKSVLLAMALALVYRLEYGGISRTELEDMRSGKLTSTDELKNGLAGLLRDYLSQLSSMEQKLLKNALFDYLASRPPLDHLMKPHLVMRGTLQNLNNNMAAAAA
jgi:hypothetical protein